MGNKYNTKDLTNQKFGFLKALRFVEKRIVKRKSGLENIEYFWEFECECGNKKIFRRDRVTTGKNRILSCGCKPNLGRWNGFKEISGSQWFTIKRNAIKRKIEFNISLEDAWNIFEKQQGLCAITGEKLYFSSHKPWYKETTASLDRIDSKRGYTIDNIQWIHKDINICKWDFSVDEFIELCEKVVKFKRKGN